MDGEKLLDLSGGFKAAHVAFALAGGLMGDLSPIIGVLRGAVMDGGEGGAAGHFIAPQLVSDESIGDVLEPLQQLAKEAFGGPCITPFLHENIEDLAVLIHGSPEIIPLPSDVDEQLVEVPGIAGPSAAVPKPLGKRLAKPQTP